ncbi:hypothetical protein JCM10369A_25940 [Nocardioides pyridinolyticus]
MIGANDLTHLEPVDLAVPHVPVLLRQVVRDSSDLYRDRQTAAVLAAGGHVADPDQRASRAFGADPSLFSADRFHPSSAGYAVIADAVLPALVDAAETLGQAS